MTKIIAEIGQNHEGDCDIARELINQAAKYTDYIKLQYWNVDNVYHKEDIRYEAAKKRELGFAQIVYLIDYIKSLGKVPVVSFFGAPLGDKACLFNIPDLIIKYAATEHEELYTDLENDELSNLLENKQILDSVIVSIDVLKIDRLPKITPSKEPIYLYCVSEYPTVDPGAALRIMVKHQQYNHTSGFSDHSIGIDAAKAAIILGADWVEKHFTTEELRNTSSFRDHIGSMTIGELKGLQKFNKQFSYNIQDPNYVSRDEAGKRRCK